MPQESAPSPREQYAADKGISYMEALSKPRYEIDQHKETIEDEQREALSGFSAQDIESAKSELVALSQKGEIPLSEAELNALDKNQLLELIDSYTAPDETPENTAVGANDAPQLEEEDDAPEANIETEIAATTPIASKRSFRERFNLPRLPRVRALAAVALATFAAAGLSSGLKSGNASAQLPGTTPIAQPADPSKAPAGASYNVFEQHTKDRMSTEGAYDGTERTAKQLDEHVLAKILNNPSLLAATLEAHESGINDSDFSLNDVNKDIASFGVSGKNGLYSKSGEKALKTLQEAWKSGSQGKLLSVSEVKELTNRYTLINHGVEAGKFKNAIDNAIYSAGVFDYRPDLGDQIFFKDLGNGHMALFKVNEEDSLRDCLNILTLKLKGASTPPHGQPTPKTGTGGGIVWENKKPETQLEAKDPTKDINRNPNLNPDAGTNGHIAGPGKEKPATDPPETYTPPAQPTPAPTVERPATSIPPVETGANGANGVNNGSAEQQPDANGV